MDNKLIQKFIEGKCSAEELNIIQAYFDSNNLKELEDDMFEKWMSEDSDHDHTIEEKLIWNNISTEISSNKKDKSKVLKLVQWSSYVAASVIILVMLNFYFNTDRINYLTTVNTSKNPIQVVLEDGTKIWLKRGSKLVYKEHFSKNERIVKLTGEAFFNVTHNKKKPFIVYHNGIKTIVLGTKFNINTESHNLAEISLFEGSVKIVNLKKNEWIIKPGEELVYNFRTSKTNIQKFDIESNNILAWKNGKYIFKNKSILKVLKSLTDYYNIEFKFDRSNLINKKITCEFPLDENLDNALEIILFPHQLDFKYENGIISIVNKK